MIQESRHRIMKASWILSTIVVTVYSSHGLINTRRCTSTHGGSTGHIRSQVFLNMSPSSAPYKSIYGIAQSGWKSSKWNWGSAIGTGHECAKICRQNYSNIKLRQVLVSNLLNAQGSKEDIPLDFEEVKLTLALAWQRGRWDGSDGGKGGYSDVLQCLEIADRYENGPEMEWSKRWIGDLASRFHLFQPSADHRLTMKSLLDESESSTGDDFSDEEIIYRVRRRCSGLVLQQMGFIENGC